MNEQNIIALQKQQKTAQFLLLGTVITTVINIVLLLANGSFGIPYSSAIAYYLTFLGFYFDSFVLGTYTATGMVMGFVVLAAWLLIWWMSKKQVGWLIAGLVMVCVDTAFLALFALVFLENPGECLWEGLLHVVVIYQISIGIKAMKTLSQPRQQPQSIPLYDPWEEETPADSQYDDNF